MNPKKPTPEQVDVLKGDLFQTLLEVARVTPEGELVVLPESLGTALKSYNDLAEAFYDRGNSVPAYKVARWAIDKALREVAELMSTYPTRNRDDESAI
jgi:hypothetical protein